MNEQEYTIKDMIAHSMEGNATKVMSAFDHLVGPKIIQALADKKAEVAKGMFASDTTQDAEMSSDDEETESQETEIEAEDDKDTEPA